MASHQVQNSSGDFPTTSNSRLNFLRFPWLPFHWLSTHPGLRFCVVDKRSLLEFGVVAETGLGHNLRIVRGERRPNMNLPGELQLLHRIYFPGFPVR